MKTRASLRRIHVWLGWIIGVPMLFWTASGLFMVARPIEEVRGSALRATPPALEVPRTLVPPDVAGGVLRALVLEPSAGGTVWIATLADGRMRRADPGTGRWLPPISAAEARRIAAASYARASVVTALERTPADAPPLDLRRPRPAWQAVFADGTHLYIDADTGAVLALRTAQWRWFDWMWGLHIMDLQSREDTSHAVLIAFAGLALVGTILAIVLLPLSQPRKRARRTG